MSGVDIAGLVEQVQVAAEITGDELLQVAADALLAQAAELAEAREEIERLARDIAVKAKLLTKSAKETRAFWDALVPKGGRCRDCADFDGRCQGDGPPCDPQAHALENLAKLTRQRDEALAALKASEEALKEIARQKLPIELWAEFGSGHEADWEGGYDACVRRARKALENSKAPLADATNNPPSDPGAEQREAGR